MGYFSEVWKAKCRHCGRELLWHLRRGYREPREWTCHCGAQNSLGSPDPYPHLPRTLYVGHDHRNLLRLYPVPPEAPDREWAQPYSIRAFVYQASHRLSGCNYFTEHQGDVWGEPSFSDRCSAPDAPDWSTSSCQLVAGFTKGGDTCPLWERVKQLCQTESERKFLFWYLSFARDRSFPMLIPQARIGIAERRRPDFVLYVPLQKRFYRWYAVQLDKAHTEEMAEEDELRDAQIEEHGYKVIRAKPEGRGYFEEVRALIEQIEQEMMRVDSDPWSVAISVPVAHYQEPKFPF